MASLDQEFTWMLQFAFHHHARMMTWWYKTNNASCILNVKLAKYLERVMQVLRNQLNAKNKVQAISNQKPCWCNKVAGETDATQRQKRSSSQCIGVPPPKSSCQWLVSIRAINQDKTGYVSTLKGWNPIQMPSEYRWQQKPDAEKEQEPSWEDKPLHSMQHHQIEQVAFLPVAWKGWTERCYRGTDQGSTRTGSEYKRDRSQDWPHQAWSKVQAV